MKKTTLLCQPQFIDYTKTFPEKPATKKDYLRKFILSFKLSGKFFSFTLLDIFPYFHPLKYHRKQFFYCLLAHCI